MVEEYKMLAVGMWLFLSKLFLLTGFINDWIQMDFYLSFHPDAISLEYHKSNSKLKRLIWLPEEKVVFYCID